MGQLQGGALQQSGVVYGAGAGAAGAVPPRMGAGAGGDCDRGE